MRTEPPQGIYENPPKGVDLTLADWSFPDVFKDEVIERLRRLDWRRYPSADAMVARQAIASRFGVAVDTVLATNGCMEALDLVARWAGQTNSGLLLPSPGYFAYGRIMNNSGVGVQTYDPAGVERVALRENAHFLICNPNNPTGDWYELETLKRLKLPDGNRLIVDSTYAFFREDDRTELFGESLHYGFINLLSFSKAFGLAGLRLGAITAPVPVLERLAAIRPRYALDLAQIVSIEVLLAERWYRHAQKQWNSVRRETLTLKS
ncbi:MAG: aminotransferase class I/II-fold pyridoxal phosphate-dependent enzyme [Hyphomicrobiales bacterium]